MINRGRCITLVRLDVL